MCYTGLKEEALMSRLLIPKDKEQKMRSLLAALKGAEKQSAQVIEIKRESVHELAHFLEEALESEALIVEEDLSPAEAGNLAGVSRPVIMHLLETGVLKGYPVKSQWRVKRDSLLKYIEERENLGKVMREMDEQGFGLD